MKKTAPLAVVLLFAVTLLFIAPACYKKPPTMARLEPVSSGNEARLTLFGTLHLGLRFLDPPTRARYLREVAGQAEDPFYPGAPDLEEPFLIFLLSVENRGENSVLLSPSFASMMDDKGKFKSGPLDIHELSGIMASNPAFTPEVSRRFHQPTVNVNPGQRQARLLAFPAMQNKAKMVEILIPSVVTGTLSADAHFPFSVTWEPVPAF